MNAATELLANLIRVDSSNPGLGDDGAGETAIADLVSTWLEATKCELIRLEDTPGRPSIVAVFRGSGGGDSIMLNGHIDTVSLGSYAGDAREPIIDSGRLYGRGAYDMKSGIAAMMVAASRAAARPHRGDILLALVADEEFASAGTEEVLRSFTADGAIVVEPSELEVTIAHRGFVWAEVTVAGVAAHGSRPDLGVDAIVGAGRFLTALGVFADALPAINPHPVLGPASVHASLIRGGVELSSYPAECVIGIEWRTNPGQGPDSVRAELEKLGAVAVAETPGLTVTVETGLSRAPFEATRDSRIVTTVIKQVAIATGAPAIERGEPFWTDCALLADAGIPAVLFGVAGGGAHAASEWVDLRSLDVVTAVLEETIVEFCG